jgi:hypothetical protein
MALIHASYRFGLRALFVVTTIVALLLGLNAWQFGRVQREQAAYNQLQALGATGDDWVDSAIGPVDRTARAPDCVPVVL